MEDQLSNDAGSEAAETPPVPESNAEVETLRVENEKLKGEIRSGKARAALAKEFTVSGARSPELLIAAAEKEIQFDDDGEPVNIAAVIVKMTQHYPEQFGTDKPASIDAGAGRSSQTSFLTREALSKMKPEEIARLDWNEVRSVLSS